MVSFLVPVTSLSLLLLVSGPLFHQALAANSVDALERVSIIAGVYSNAFHQSGNYNRLVRPNMTITYRPVDIPALNEYLPSLLEKTFDGKLITAGVLLYLDEATSCVFYDSTDLDDYRTNIQNNYASLTFDDLPSIPMCEAKAMRLYDEVTDEWECHADGFVIKYKCITSCTSLTAVDVEEGPGNSSYLTKIQQLPLPDSWLDGVDQCVNPCG